MDAAFRFSGSAASVLGLVSQLILVSVALPGFRSCLGCGSGGAPPLQVVDTWRPFVDNPGEGWMDGRSDPLCPEPRERGDPYNLTAAPLPDGYDPHSYGERRVYACVLVGADGEVLTARMLRGTGRAVRDGHLVWTIRLRWQFRPSYPAPRAPSWQRVRLSSGDVDGAVWHPPLLF